MARVAYVNGRYVHHTEAVIHVEDRSCQFSDGVYEVVALHRGRFVDLGRHLDRLSASLAELRIGWPLGRRALESVMAELVRRNRISGEGILYLQVSRGVAPRAHAFPARPVRPGLVMTVRPTPPFDPEQATVNAAAVVTAPDIRWKRPDIKTVSLLPNVLYKQQALDAGAFDTWMVDGEGCVTEGTASNAWIVTVEGDLVTRRPDSSILRGITRGAVIEALAGEGIPLVERPFTVEEAKSAREAFATSATTLVKPVVSVDGQTIGDGTAGPLTRRIIALYAAHMDAEAAR